MLKTHSVRMEVIRQELYIGRGDRLYPHPVSLEPAFTPFDPFRPWVGGRNPGREGTVRNFQFIRVRPFEEDRYSSDLAEQLLLSLNPSHPIAFEVLGVEGDVALQMAASPQDGDFIVGQIRAYYSDCEAFEDEDLVLDMAERLVIARGYRLRRSHLFSLREGHRTDPYTSLIGVMGTIGSRDAAVFQVLLTPVSHNWRGNALRLSRHPYDRSKSMFADMPQLPRKAESKVSKPLFAVGIRMAASSEELLNVLEGSFLTQFESEDNRLEKI